MQKFNKYDFEVTTGFEFMVDFPTIKITGFAEIILILTNYKSSSNYRGVIDFRTVGGTNKIIVVFNGERAKEDCFEIFKAIINRVDSEFDGYSLEFLGECELIRFNGMYDLQQQGIIKDCYTARMMDNLEK